MEAEGVTVRELIEELQRLPPQVLEQDVRIKTSDYGMGANLTDVVWIGNAVKLEAN